ncbi:MAG: PBP1A family penicillin-binding protein [Verrucomicrobiae bacterium]|nr:PBP1A family penicillin-binding protein [Verrucomicrobiae bacterium]
MARRRRSSSSSARRSTSRGPFSSLGTGKRRSKRRSKKKGGSFTRSVGRLIRTGLFLGTFAAVAGTAYYGWKATQFDLSLVKEIPERTLVYDHNGILMGHVAGHGENRVSVPASQVSEHFIKALLAREDNRFYDHHGVDPIGVLRALVTNVKSGGKAQGASTITMQLARNTYGMREMSLQRKIMEAALAIRLEREYSKEEILTFYMNRVYFGSGLYGIERASQGYFMKPASQLTLAEGAMLAGVIRGPSLLNPFRSMENAKDIQGEVLDRLVASDLVTRAEADVAKGQPIALRPPDQRFATGSYPLQSVFDLLEDYLAPHLIENGGLRIYTTIDSELQKVAQAELDRHLTEIEHRAGYPHSPRSSHKKGSTTRYLQGSVVSLDNRTGGIVTLVGGRNFSESSFNRAFLAKRQIGSTFKPFVYAVAFHLAGLQPNTRISDDPVKIGNWSPKNSDNTYQGKLPAAVGLIRSRNTMSVRVGQMAGISNIRDLAKALKLGDIPNSPAITLGAFETTPVNITSAYSTFATGGVNLAPFLISKIEHADGTVLYEHENNGRRIFPENVAWTVSNILGKVLDEGTATESRRLGYQAPAYGKTGTTNDYHDAWFVGYSDKLTTGVWVGLDQPKTIMERGYGSTLALPVWTGVMKAAESKGYMAARLPGTNSGLLVASPVEGAAAPGNGPGEGGLGKAFRGVGRFLFGESKR